ncbi:MAG: amidohydrolase family protein [Saprospiraceae bacterium]|nr:amidohydrolase family protein [Saprospiraceae bacterium]
MQIRKLTADFIHDGKNGFFKNHILILHGKGTVLEFRAASENELKDCNYYPGILTPGFVNAHCHLELSHLKGKFQTGTKLIPFLKSVVTHRGEDLEEIQSAIKAADEEMQREGIVAVGDISNKTDTIEIKKSSPIKYYSFIEAFDFLQEKLTDSLFENYREVYTAFEDLPKSMVPHAAYSVSSAMFNKINRLNNHSNHILSIHNQESPDDDLLFQSKSGGYPEFWSGFGFSMEHFEPNGVDSLKYIMDQLSAENKLLLIHNTQSRIHHIQRLQEWNSNIYFVTCPNANLFIENTLPEYRHFVNANSNMAIGTDSLSSNWKLSVLSEMQTILKYNAWLDLETVLKWATMNGATALGMQNDLGSFTPNKNPGVNWINEVYSDQDQLKIKDSARVQKI